MELEKEYKQNNLSKVMIQVATHCIMCLLHKTVPYNNTQQWQTYLNIKSYINIFIIIEFLHTMA